MHILTRCLAICMLVAGMAVLRAGEAKKFESIAEEREILTLTNRERKAKELPPLKLSVTLSKVARAHSENMARQGKMEHTLDKKTPFDRIKASGYRYFAAGENIAMGEEGAKLSAIMKAWMESKGHRENILDTRFMEIGIGIATSKDGTMYLTQVFAKPRK
ncbi:MAG TPA: CAP domain-containing protein [Gemmataceae bacterium]|nr:CAP domain-containing protein [Gemmataceae bacterium]